MSIIGHTIPVNYQVALIVFEENEIQFGSKPNTLTLPLYTWGYYFFTIDADVDPDALQIQVVPTQVRTLFISPTNQPTNQRANQPAN